MHKNTPIVITGCQRSGTTLLNLILDSHPDISGIDEEFFKPEDLERYLNDINFYPFVSFKLPTFASEISFLKSLPKLKVIWCVRDYRDVIASMMSLNLPWNDVLTPWALHPSGALMEIRNCEAVLRHKLKPDLKKLLRKYSSMHQSLLSERTRDKMVFVGALCWRMKQEVLLLYKSNKIDHQVFRYEQLIEAPNVELQKLFSFLNIPWHDDLLSHHKLHSGLSIGNTDNTRAIDSSNRGKWEKVLNAHDISIINKVCLKTARKFDFY